jgi:hypothetical protein
MLDGINRALQGIGVKKQAFINFSESMKDHYRFTYIIEETNLTN